MNVEELLAVLSEQGVELWIEGGKLRFRAPKGTLTPELRTRLSEQKEGLLAAVRERARQNVIQRPLSHNQTGLWLINQAAPSSAAYNVAFAIRICSNPDVPALRQAFQAVVDRHEILRTTYTLEDGKPLQQVHGYSDVDFEQVSASGCPDNVLYERVVESYEQPFDLEHGPVMRVRLFTRAADDHILLLAAHHIALDGWSIWLLLDDLRQLYAAYTRDESVSLPRLNAEYADYVRWQRDLLASPEGEQLWSFWQQQLAGELPTLDLPTDYVRPLLPTYSGHSEPFSIDRELAQQLRNLAKIEGVTLYVLLLAAFQVLLHRYTGQEEVITGAAMFGRNRPEFASIVGHFVNVVPLRTKFEGDPTFKDFLSLSRQNVFKMLEHQDFPFPLMVERLKDNSDSSRSPVFQATFDLQRVQQVDELSDLFIPNSSGKRVVFGGLEVEQYSMPQQEGQFDLGVQILETNDAMPGAIKLSTDLFSPETGKRMSGHYLTLLRGIVAHPEQRLSELPLLTEAERHQLLVEWNNTRQDYPQNLSIHQLFEAQVESNPEAVALSFQGKSLTYQDLDDRANQLAHHLRKQGVGPEVLVALCVQRSLEMVVAIVGVLKAGGAYVPLDATYPQERLAYMLADTRAPVMLTQSTLLSNLPPYEGKVICLDTDWEQIATEPTTRPSLVTSPDNLAYLIYTSGSTGKPKGVQLEHRGGCNLAAAQKQMFDPQPGDRVLQVASLSFDAATWEVLMALCWGATLVVPPPEVLLAGDALRDILRAEKITHATIIPSALATVPFEPLPDLKVLVVAGEACSPELVAKWSKGRRFFNGYGPTESTVCATAAEVTDDTKIPPIGRPLPNTEIYILDSALQPVPIGIAGQLYIGGIGLSRGYLNRPELTAEKFISHPFKAGARLYKTGDLTRYRPDGNVEFLGRIDYQVKIRGFRIELGEIEALLNTHPDVSKAVVIAREDSPGDKRLVAYVVSAGNDALSPVELREVLKHRLPAYMIPSAFITLETFPLTPNGKLDTRALPAPEQVLVDTTKQFLAPRTPIERTLADIWAEVLNVPRVGIDDNFFELGGDSILSIQVVSRAKAAGLKLTPRLIFQHQTIAELAIVTGLALASQGAVGVNTEPIPLTPIQHWFLEQELEEMHHWNQAVMLNVSPSVDVTQLERAVEQMIVHHDALRLRFYHGESGWQQVYVPYDRVVPFTRIDLSGLESDEQARVLAEETNRLQATLDLSNGPLLRAAWFNLGYEQPGRLLLIIHHLAVDGVSWRVLLEDLLFLYEKLTLNEAASLPPKTTAFSEWASRLNSYAKSETMRSEAAYWSAIANQAALSLPVDYDDAANTEESTCQVSTLLSQEETTALLYQMPKIYRAQVNDLLLAALAITLTRQTGSASPVRIHVEGHGREDIFDDVDLSRTVGWFTSIYPVLLKLSPDASLFQIVTEVKEQLRSIPNHGVGYGIIRYLSDDPGLRQALATAPEPEIIFNYLGQFENVLPASGLFQWAAESAGTVHSPKAHRRYMLELSGLVVNGQLRVDWTYSANCLQPSTVESLAAEYLNTLRGLVTASRTPEERSYSASDFPLAKLTPPALEWLIKSYPNIEDVYPLSPLQEGMLFHALSPTVEGEYFEQLNYTLYGVFDVVIFERALQHVVDRHPTLRTAFVWQKLEKPMQIVLPSAPLSVSVLDWRGMSPEEQQTQLVTFLDEDRRRGFDLNTAPLVRFAAIRMGDETHQIVFSSHHLIMDGWSLAAIFSEISVIYNALAQGVPVNLPAARPYRDFIAWLQRQDTTRAESFWRTLLKGFTTPTPLGFDRLRTERPSGGLATYIEQEISFSADEMAALQKFARQSHLTLNTLVQGTWAILLNCYSQESDVVFGVTHSGRPAHLPGVETMLGLFINTLPARVRITGEDRLLPWLEALQSQQTDAQEFVHTPLVNVQTWSEVKRGQSLFDSIIVFENYPVNRSLSESGGTRLGKASVFERTNYPLVVTVMPGETLLIRLVYDSQRFSGEAITRLLGQWHTVLTAMIAQPESRVVDIPVLTQTEQRQLLVEWNDTHRDYPLDTSVYQLFEAQVARTPDSVAVIFEDAQLTYSELNHRANRLAHYLRSLGVEPEVMVGIFVERSIDMVVGLLGVLKAGGAYVPMDPAFPRERLGYMVEDADLSVIVTQSSLVDSLPAHTAQLVCLDTDQALSTYPEDNLSCQTTADTLAYVIFTSGSTGRPKGVQVTHGSLINFLLTMAEEPGIASNDTVLAMTTLSFDIAGLEIYLPLIAGARMVVVSRETATDGNALAKALERYGVTIMQATPSSWRLLLEAGWNGHDGLKMLCGGEGLPRDLAWQLLERGAELWNVYGPTETTIWSTAGRIESREEVISIGRPIANTSIYVLNEYLRPVPIGVPGALWIGGAGVARGYLKRPELTAEKFVPDPFNPDTSARIYNTGDLARWLPDGELECLGRTDQQVKIRGYRIELGEIEAALVEHPAIEKSVVTAREDTPGDKRLVAYYVPRDGGTLTAQELRDFLKAKLPTYMIPTAYMALDVFPITPNGKIDRRALPVPEQTRQEVVQPIAAPQTPTETVLVEIWEEVLQIDQVSIYDNFFDLGGHSLQAMQVITKAQERTGRRLDPAMMRVMTLSQIAAAYDNMEMEAPQPEPPEANAGRSQKLLSGIRRLVSKQK